VQKKYLFLIIVIGLCLLLTGCDDLFSGVISGKRTGSINGRVVNYEMKPLLGVNVAVSGKSGSTDKDGLFRIEDLEVGKYSLVFSHDNYNTKAMEIYVEEGSNSLGDIKMEEEGFDYEVVGLKTFPYAATWSNGYYIRCPWIYGFSAETGEVSGYKLYRSGSFDGPFEMIDDNVNYSESQGNYFIDFTVEEGTYFYKVSAFNQDGKETELSSETAQFELKEPLNIIQPEDNIKVERGTELLFDATSEFEYDYYRLLIKKFDDSKSEIFQNEDPTFVINIDMEIGNYQWHIEGFKQISDSNCISAKVEVNNLEVIE